jgi:hypothetical protein
MNDATFASGSNLTMEQLQAMLAAIPPDPLKQFVLDHGFDPDTGAILVLPEEFREMAGRFPPEFVRFSSALEDEAFIVNLGLMEAEALAFMGEPMRLPLLPFPLGGFLA